MAAPPAFLVGLLRCPAFPFLSGKELSKIDLIYTLIFHISLLPSGQFTRVHRSYMVAPDKIKYLEGTQEPIALTMN